MEKKDVRAILLDIEGTTTPISFVHNVLFPYSQLHLESFLAQHAESPEVSSDIELLRAEHSADVSDGRQAPPLVEPYLHWLIKQDRKSPALKSLQGKIWQYGYRDGSLRSSVFADVPVAMQRWRKEGINVSIFSSGSVLAQKLLFAHTESGDLTKLIDSYFDTGVGKKTDSASYRENCNVTFTGAKPNSVHFGCSERA
jgi:enolase-phosphatase E1